MSRVLDLSGQVFGNWLVHPKSELRPIFKKGNKVTWWFCICSCGKERWVRATNLLKGLSSSCGHAKYDSALRMYFAKYKHAARSRGLSFKLRLSDFVDLCARPCYWCGRAPFNKIRSMAGVVSVVSGVDRVDNDSGYLIHNSVPCCIDCNRAKLCLSKSEFIALCTMVVSQHA